MQKIKKISFKIQDGTFSNPLNIGADAINVDMSNGNNVEKEISDFGELINTKVDKENGKGLVSDIEREAWNKTYQQATGYTDQQIANLINGAPSTLDTLGEIATAMQDNADVVEALNVAIGTKANQAEVESLFGIVNQQLGGLTFVKCTQSEYDALGSNRPNNTIYFIEG